MHLALQCSFGQIEVFVYLHRSKQKYSFVFACILNACSHMKSFVTYLKSIIMNLAHQCFMVFLILKLTIYLRFYRIDF